MAAVSFFVVVELQGIEAEENGCAFIPSLLPQRQRLCSLPVWHRRKSKITEIRLILKTTKQTALSTKI